MMKVIKSGKMGSPIYRATCVCGCEFECDREHAWQAWFADQWYAGCPQCDRVNVVKWHHDAGKLIPPQGGSGTAPPKADRCLSAQAEGGKEKEVSPTGYRGYDG